MKKPVKRHHDTAAPKVSLTHIDAPPSRRERLLRYFNGSPFRKIGTNLLFLSQRACDIASAFMKRKMSREDFYKLKPDELHTLSPQKKRRFLLSLSEIPLSKDSSDPTFIQWIQFAMSLPEEDFCLFIKKLATDSQHDRFWTQTLNRISPRIISLGKLFPSANSSKKVHVICEEFYGCLNQEAASDLKKARSIAYFFGLCLEPHQRHFVDELYEKDCMDKVDTIIRDWKSGIFDLFDPVGDFNLNLYNDPSDYSSTFEFGTQVEHPLHDSFDPSSQFFNSALPPEFKAFQQRSHDFEDGYFFDPAPLDSFESPQHFEPIDFGFTSFSDPVSYKDLNKELDFFRRLEQQPPAHGFSNGFDPGLSSDFTSHFGFNQNFPPQANPGPDFDDNSFDARRNPYLN